MARLVGVPDETGLAFEEFVRGRLPVLLRFAAVLTGDLGLAEEVVQEVFVRVHQGWTRISRADRPDAYVRRMIVNEFLSRRRGQWRVIPVAAVHDAPDDRPDPASVYAEREALAQELAQLPPRQRAVMVLRYYEGMSDREIAEALGCSSVTVRGYASRALATLRVQVGRDSFLLKGAC